jgi:hypothetical protein
MPENKAPWHPENEDRARDDFGDKPEPEKKPPPREQAAANPLTPVEAERKTLDLKRRYARWYQDNSGKHDPTVKPPKPHRHTKDQIEKWADCRRGALAEKYRATDVEQRKQHELQKNKWHEVHEPTLSIKEEFALFSMNKRQNDEQDRLKTNRTRDEFNLNALVSSSHEAGQILDREYLDQLSREEKDRGDEAPDQEIDTGRTGEGRSL